MRRDLRELTFICPHCGGSACLDVECGLDEDDASIAADLTLECCACGDVEMLHLPEWRQ
jgi:hypothetical protein